MSVALLFTADDAWAQPPVDSGFGDITVTARKREESLLDVPVAITALSSKALDAANVQSIEDIAAVTPGIQMNSIAGGQNRSDRSKTTAIIRGMAPSSGANTTSIFVDGVPANGTAISGIFDFARVEVLKGPQSAYFGRQTFAGAVNLVTAQPTNTFEGYVSALAGTDEYYDIKGALGGPIVPDVLAFRASGRYYSRHGTWGNAAEPGNTLGDQSTRSGTLALKFTPSSDLTVDLFGVVSNDDDGNGAYSIIQASQSNCTLPGGTPYFCGTLPALAVGQPSVRTVMNTGLTNMLKAGLLLPLEERVSHMGFRRDTRTLNGRISYDVSDGVNLASLTGYSHSQWSMLSQMGGAASMIPNTFTSGPNAQQYTDWPLAQDHIDKNFSQEIRLSSTGKGPFKWVFGGSYLWSKVRETYVQLYYLADIETGYAPATAESRTWSAFAGLSYDISKAFTVNFDGRYQIDTLSSRDGQTDVVGYRKVYRNFMPRVSLQYRLNSDMMVYATYSKGVNPGLAQDPLISTPAAYRDYLRSIGVTNGVSPEKLDNYEIGLKGKFFDGKLIVSADAYFDIWTDKIVSSAVLIPVQGQAPIYIFVNRNTGKVDLPGAEMEITAMPTRNLTLSLSGAINGSKIKTAGTCDVCAAQTGQSDATGNRLPYTPKYSANAWAEYRASFVPLDGYDWYFRPEVNYKGSIYESEGNYAKTSPSTLVNFRVGLRSSKWDIEAFVTNAFNNKAYTSARPGWSLQNSTESFGAYSTVYVGLQDLRRFGLRVRRDF